MKTGIIPFSGLSLDLLHDILALRNKVFIIEQDCIYQDVDGRDKQSYHVVITDKGNLAGYARIIPPMDSTGYCAIGRVVVNPDNRRTGLGKKLMKNAIAFAKAKKYPFIQISAQTYLDRFYSEIGFVKEGEPYLEDGIPHQKMLLSLT
jgi:ElaA protein